MKLTAEVVKVSGKCYAAFQQGDAFAVADFNIIPLDHSRSCVLLCSTIIQNAGRLRFEKKPLFISCQDPGTGEGGNVMVKISTGES